MGRPLIVYCTSHTADVNNTCIWDGIDRATRTITVDTSTVNGVTRRHAGRMTEVEEQQIVDEEDGTISCCAALPAVSDLRKPVHVGDG
jgi:hypothetical protein